MGTRARIGVQNEDGSVTSIYSHWDGYPTHVGVILRDHYATPEQIEPLLAEGDVSSLHEEIGEQHDFDTPRRDLPEEQRRWTLFYRRDRGETNVDAREHASDDWPDYGQEWEYLFVPGEGWRCRGLWRDDKSWRPLEAWIADEQEREAAFYAEMKEDPA